jgi:[ribosomal protein S18]-alanine N-acetyltransferase
MSCELTALPTGAAAPLSVMHAACFPAEPWDAAVMERLQALAGMFGYLAWQGDAPTGFVLARDLGDEIEIISLGVLPRCRRQGVGRALLDAVVAAARRREVASVVLEVAAANRSARSLYASAGFIQVGCRPGYYRYFGERGDGLILRRGIARTTTG